MRPLFARALPEHEALMQEAGATRYLRKEGWLKLYRTRGRASRDRARARARHRIRSAATTGSTATARSRSSRRWRRQFVNAVHWQGAASVTNPLALTRAYSRASPRSAASC